MSHNGKRPTNVVPNPDVPPPPPTPPEYESGKERFMSTVPSYCAGGHGVAYGGHVYAQAVWAAAQTVGPGMVVHVSIS